MPDLPLLHQEHALAGGLGVEQLVGLVRLIELPAVGEQLFDVEALFTHRWKLEQAEEAYKLFDTQTTGKGVFVM